MPTFRVTDPATGRTVKLIGDSPPTEQELEDIFKGLGGAAGPAPVAAPAATTPASPMLAWNGVTGSLVPKETQLRAASAIAGSEQAPLNPEVSRIPLLGPVLDIARAVRAAGPDVARGLVNNPVETIRGGAAGATEGLMDLASPLNIALQGLPYLRNVLRAKPPAPVNPLAARTGTGMAPVEPVPAAGGFGAATPTSPGIPGPAPRPLPPEAVTTGTGTLPVPPPAPAAPPVARPGVTGTGGWAMKVPAAQVVDDVVKTTTEAAHAGAAPADLVKKTEEQVRTAIPDLVSELQDVMRRGRDYFGSQRWGDMAFGNSKNGGVLTPAQRKAVVKRLAPGDSKTPGLVKDYKQGTMAQREAGGVEAQLRASLAERAKGEGGAVSPLLATQVGGAAAGGLAGAASGEDTDDKIVRGIIGTGLGAAAPLAIAKVGSVGLGKSIQNTIYTTTLSSPVSVAKAYLGAIGGAVSAAGELSVTDPAASKRILETLFSRQSAGAFVKAFKGNQQIAGGSGMAQDAPTFIGRFFNAGDAVAKQAMAAGGIGPDDAARYTLAGLPTTEIGQGILKLWNQSFMLRMATTLFPRVGVQVIERGLERSPLGLAGLKGINEGAGAATKAVRAGVGTAAGLAAYEFQDQIPDGWKPLLLAAAGPYSLPAGVGMAAGKARELGKDTVGTVKAAAGEVARNMPFPQYGPTENLMQHATGSTFMPAAMRDVAVAMDPYERETPGFFDRAKAKIPGLREQLPVKGRRVNIAGEPITDRSTPLRRVVNPAPSQNAPFKNIPEKVASEVKRLGISLNPPSFEKKAKIGGKEIPVPPDAAERLQRERRQFLVPAIEKLISSPAYQAASDDVKKRRLNAVINQAEERGAAKARKTLAQILKGAPHEPKR